MLAPASLNRPSEAELRQTLLTDLSVLQSATYYSNWLFSHVSRDLGCRILEIGSGIGNYTPLLREHGEVWATEVEEELLAELTRGFGDDIGCRVSKLDVAHPTTSDRDALAQFRPDTIVAMNVLEHIERDAEAVRFLHEGLAPSGSLRLIVPALPALLSPLDRAYGHYRRYRKGDAERLIEGLAGVRIEALYYFNLLGAFGWWLNHVVFERDRLSLRQVRLFDHLTRIWAGLERRIKPPAGLSLVIWFSRAT